MVCIITFSQICLIKVILSITRMCHAIYLFTLDTIGVLKEKYTILGILLVQTLFKHAFNVLLSPENTISP